MDNKKLTTLQVEPLDIVDFNRTEFTNFKSEFERLELNSKNRQPQVADVNKNLWQRWIAIIIACCVVIYIALIASLPSVLGVVLIFGSIILIISQHPNFQYKDGCNAGIEKWKDYDVMMKEKKELYINLLMGELRLRYGELTKSINLDGGTAYLLLRNYYPNISYSFDDEIGENYIWNRYDERGVISTDLDLHNALKLSAYAYMNSYVFVFEEKSIIFLAGVKLDFKDIVNFEIYDNSKSIYSGKTTTNTGNAVGRAIVGGALFGGVGAIIGGATASQTEYGTTTIQHSYSMVISVDSISTPNITINLKSNQTATNELASLLSVIVNRNNLSN